MFNWLIRMWLRGRLLEYNLALEMEQQRVNEWPARQRLWLRERAAVASKLDRLRGARDLVNHQFRGR